MFMKVGDHSLEFFLTRYIYTSGKVIWKLEYQLIKYAVFVCKAIRTYVTYNVIQWTMLFMGLSPNQLKCLPAQASQDSF